MAMQVSGLETLVILDGLDVTAQLGVAQGREGPLR